MAAREQYILLNTLVHHRVEQNRDCCDVANKKLMRFHATRRLAGRFQEDIFLALREISITVMLRTQEIQAINVDLVNPYFGKLAHHSHLLQAGRR